MNNNRSLARGTQTPLLGAVATLLVLACGYAASRLDQRALEAAPHWVLLAALLIGSVSGIVWAVRRGELMTPIGVTALTVLGYFVVRPLQLSLQAGDLLATPYNSSATPLQSVLDLGAQEINLYVHTRLDRSLDAALTRALAALTLCFVAFAVGYRLEISRRLAARASAVGRRIGEIDVSVVVGVWLFVGLAGQALIYAQIGGLATAVSELGTQSNLAVGFGFLVILNFYTVGLLLWICFHTPRTRTGKLALGLAVGEFVVFLALLGSRTLVLIPILLSLVALDQSYRPIRVRTLVPVALVVVLFAAGYLGARENVGSRSLSEVASDIPRYAFDGGLILNSSPVFDQLLMETNYVPSRAPYRHGGELAQGVLGQVPSLVYPGKPEATDITFRKLIWGERFLAGRPTGAAGEFYRDFGFPGLAVGGLLLGLLARMLTGLHARMGGPEGRGFRAVLYVLGILLLYEMLVGSYSVALGFALEVAIPLSIAIALGVRRA